MASMSKMLMRKEKKATCASSKYIKKKIWRRRRKINLHLRQGEEQKDKVHHQGPMQVKKVS